ncbi:MAG: glycoside hydrolase family 2 TIM barrel-domain containing protein [Bacteroidota bacterium]
MKNFYLLLVFLLLTLTAQSQTDQVSVSKEISGMKLMVNGKPFIVNGVNWDYVPIGTTITDPGIWSRPDDIIMAALDGEMSLLKNMGVNAIRTYDLKPKWITYIYENYGIYTMLNITFGAYGLNINGAWVPETNYADPATREVLMAEARQMAQTYKDTPGLLLYMIGNENNYHLSWSGAETEAIPIEGIDSNKLQAARALYKAFNDATLEVKKIDRSHPVAICNGDLLYLDLVKQECRDIDIYGTNMYRGIAFGDAFQRVKDELNMPILFAEFGADAFNAKENREDQYTQAYYDVGNWKDIYENTAGHGKAGNSLGGFTFQFSDGWWKYKQTEDFEVHNTVATWPNDGYPLDQEEPGFFNMNEEWFGICAKGPTNFRGLYTLYPRAAYYALKEVHEINPYEVSTEGMANHFNGIQLMDAVLRARGDQAALSGEGGQKLGLSELRAEISTFNTGGKLITTPDDADPNGTTFPNQLGFDAMESYYVGFEANPASNVSAHVVFNLVGNVALNPINELFYENRARPQLLVTQNNGPVQSALERLQLYQAEYSWDHKYFNLKGFYRTGHYHWGYEGDFFGLYPEANYGPNLDIYGGLAPQGVEIEGKKELEGLKVAYGQELWWGANPAVLVKYSKEVGGVDLTGIFHEDIQAPGAAITSIAVPQPRTRRMTLHAKKELGKLTVEAGGIWGGQPLVDREFQFTRGNEGSYQVFTDQVQNSDTWGGKFKVTYQSGRINWYAQGAAMGLVAFGGGDPTQTFTGWRLKDTGSGNVNSLFTGFTYRMGKWEIAPNFMYQKPLVDPMPDNLGEGTPGRLRNILDDPFVVRANRETVGGELLLTFDPTPGTWMYSWDNDRNEDATIAASVGFVYRHLPTNMDAAIIFDDTGRTPVAAPGTPPALDLWEVNTRIVSKLNPELGIVANLFGGNGQANGPDARTVERYGGDVRVIYKSIKLASHLKFNDWGPFDYHRDFNLTFPLQIMADLSTTVGKPDWFILPSTTIGMRFMWRSLNENSPRFSPNEAPDLASAPRTGPAPVGFPNGNEWELRTYVHINLGK